MKRMIVISTLLLGCMLTILLFRLRPVRLSNLKYSQSNKLQVITAMGNPAYGADSKIITEQNEINRFIDTFNSGVVSKKVGSNEIANGFTSRYIFYSNNSVVASFEFNCNNINVMWWDDHYRSVEYDNALKTPFELYKDSPSQMIVVNEKGEEMDLVRFKGNSYVKSELSDEAIEWLKWYGKLSETEQQSILNYPDMGDPFQP